MNWLQHVAVVAVGGFVLAMPAAQGAELSANEIMQRNLYATKISGFTGEATITLINDQAENRVRKIAVRSRLKDNGIDSQVLMRFSQPPDIKGTAFLQNENSAGDDDIWVYLPALGKTRRLVASNKKDSFFGTDFSYGDILLPAVDKYKHTLTGSESIDGNDCYVIESLPVDPKVRDDNGYARKLSWIDKKSFLESKVVYYDVTNKLLKTQTSFDHRQVEPDKQRWFPMRREMVNHQTRHKTMYHFDRFDLSRSLTDQLFNTRSMERE